MLNTKDIIKEYEEMGLIFPMTVDAVFKSIIQDDDLKDYASYIISFIDKRDIKKEDLIFVNTEGTKKTIIR